VGVTHIRRRSCRYDDVATITERICSSASNMFNELPFVFAQVGR